MTILPLIIEPDPLLHQISAKLEVVDDDVRQLAADMLETMYASKGVGLAAVQIGQLKRMLVADVAWKDADTPGEQHVLINPEILAQDEEPHSYKEGCLSFPEQYAEVTRPKTVKVKYQDVQGAWIEREFEGLLATCIQHEIDHINGIVFVDHISKLKRGMITKRLTKMKKQGYFDSHVHDEHCQH